MACCRRHGDLAAALKKLKARQGCHLFSRLDKIIIEGADACDAADVHVAFLDEEVASFARLDAIVSCVRLEAKCDVDMGLIQDWLHELRTEGAASDVFSVKGTLAVRHAPKKYRYAAVHLDAKNAVGRFGDERLGRRPHRPPMPRRPQPRRDEAPGPLRGLPRDGRELPADRRGPAVQDRRRRRGYCEGGWERGRVVKRASTRRPSGRGRRVSWRRTRSGSTAAAHPLPRRRQQRPARASPPPRGARPPLRTNYKRRGVRACAMHGSGRAAVLGRLAASRAAVLRILRRFTGAGARARARVKAVLSSARP